MHVAGISVASTTQVQPKGIAVSRRSLVGVGFGKAGWKPTWQPIRLKVCGDEAVDRLRTQLHKTLNALADERDFAGLNIEPTELEKLGEATEPSQEGV
jgi:hypothetical protein